jgi:hypothetical protein
MGVRTGEKKKLDASIRRREQVYTLTQLNPIYLTYHVNYIHTVISVDNKKDSENVKGCDFTQLSLL